MSTSLSHKDPSAFASVGAPTAHTLAVLARLQRLQAALPLQRSAEGARRTAEEMGAAIASCANKDRRWVWETAINNLVRGLHAATQRAQASEGAALVELLAQAEHSPDAQHAEQLARAMLAAVRAAPDAAQDTVWLALLTQLIARGPSPV